MLLYIYCYQEGVEELRFCLQLIVEGWVKIAKGSFTYYVIS